MSKDLILSIDSGTQSCRAIVWDLQGNTISEGRAEHSVEHIRLGWFEQDARDWWPATAASIREAVEGIDTGRLLGMSISHQRETVVPVDDNWEPLRHALPHMDMRSEQQVQSVIDRVGGERVHEITGKFPSYVSSLYKILWIREQEPQIDAKINKYLDVQGFLLRHLIGEAVTPDISADPFALVDIQSRTWSSELMGALDLDRSRFLDLTKPGTVVGKITREAASATGLPEGLEVVAGAGDGICAAYGTNTTSEEDIFFYIGTWTVLGGYSTNYVIGDAFRTLLGVTPGSYHLEANVAGGYVVSWFLENFSKDSQKEKEAHWEKLAEKVPPGSDGLMTVPYWFGALAPYWDNSSRGITLGWSGIHTPAHMYRSVLEGVSLEHRMLLEGIAEALSADYSEVTFVGGGAKSPLWGQITADVFGIPISISNTVEASALGAAIIGAAGTGAFDSLSDAADAMTSAKPGYTPDPGLRKIYDDLFEVYKGVFPVLQKQIHSLSDTIERHSAG